MPRGVKFTQKERQALSVLMSGAWARRRSRRPGRAVQFNPEAPDNLFGVRREDWEAFERLRQSGEVNMMGARQLLGLSREEFMAILQNYSDMEEAWG